MEFASAAPWVNIRRACSSRGHPIPNRSPYPRVPHGPRSLSMSSWSRLAAACLALLLSAPALAVELNYKWKKGDTHRFSSEDDTTIEMAMAGMPGMPGMGAGGMKLKV